MVAPSKRFPCCAKWSERTCRRFPLARVMEMRDLIQRERRYTTFAL